MYALDLFCGMGGASLGLERAGFTVTGIEHDATAARLHDHLCARSTATVIADIARLQCDREWYDLIWASPPCQPFSAAGLKKGLDDPRGHLIFQVPRWVHAIRPKYVICEQVKSVLPWWEGFAADFKEIGYDTWTGVLSSEQFGVPQTRQRAFLLARRVDAADLRPPRPTHRKYHSREPHLRPLDDHLEPYVSMADVIDIDDTDLVGFPRRADKGESINGMRRRDLRSGDEPAFTMTSKGRSWSINTGRDWKPGGDRSTAQQRESDKPSPTVTTKTDKWWLVGRQSKATARHEDAPAPTITAGHDITQWSLGGRMITVGDGLALQTFPADCLDGVKVTKTAAFKAIGNAVPPLWAYKIVQHLTKGTT